ncbi:uncharacterized protein N7446_007758 [Penicillium canescens]|uniref:uncharacterized protein n=1 Tax=Penicillium canescens TaxID=5083 RepID=UPI0026DFEE06|nr:uncharacterized protein N7446_007758 [Penicillium canescens]KAJ6058175.1 hypothetical protein N7446_007758 [Penicillium canescens]
MPRAAPTFNMYFTLDKNMSSSSVSQKVIIVGATGNLGPHLVSAIDSDPHFQVSILSRDSSDCSKFPQHIAVHRVNNYDASDTNLVKILTGQDVIISAIATQAVLQQKAIIDAAVKAGVKHFVPSEYGHDTRNERAAQLLPPCFFTHKKQIVEYLQSKETEGLKWTAFVTGPFFETTVAVAVKNAISAPAEIVNKYLFVESFNVSQNKILSSVESLTKAKWDVSYHDAGEQRQLASEKLSRRDYSGLPTLMGYVTCVDGYGGDYMQYEESANDMLSLPRESLDSALKKMEKRALKGK